MADKEASVFVVDCGRSMGEKRHGRNESDLDWAMRYVWDKITTMVSTGRKTLYAGVVGLRTDETQNDLAVEPGESYDHISVLQELSQSQMPEIRQLKEKLKPSSTDDGDAISAIVIAIEMISKFCKRLKYIRRITVVTNGTGLIDSELLSDIAHKIRTEGIDLVVLGADFDDPDYGLKEEDKDQIKAENERTLSRLTDESGGVFGTLEQATTELAIPRIKTVRPTNNFRGGKLTLGNANQYGMALEINVERYPKTMVAKPPSARKLVIRSAAGLDDVDTATANNHNDALTHVENPRAYQVEDETAPGGKRDVNYDDLSKGYEYGRTAVPISKSDEGVVELKNKMGLEILGFVPAANFKHYMAMSRSYILIAERTNKKAVMAMSSLIHALFELEKYAIARLVVKEDSEPTLCILGWHDLNETECLYEVELPFAEDVRSYKFPPLDRIVTISGKVLKEHRNLPNADVMKAMDEYVDKMDISNYGKDDEGNPTEYLPLSEMYSPILHRINEVVRFRALYPSEPIPPPSSVLLKPSKPPEDLVTAAASAVDKLREGAAVKKVPPKSLSKKLGRGRASETPLSGLNVSALLSSTQKSKGITITPENAVPEFRQALEAAESVEATRTAVKQLSGIIEDWIRHSFGDLQYERAVEALRVMRECCVELEDPQVYNDWFKSLKKKILDGELGGDRREFWRKIVGIRLGLIQKRECDVSNVEAEEAKEFLTMK